MSNIWQVVIHDQLMRESIDGDTSTHTKEEDVLHGHHELSEGSPQAELIEERGDEIMSQAAASSTNKHLSFK